MGRRGATGRGVRPPVRNGPALWVEESRPFDSVYFGLTPSVHGPGDDADREPVPAAGRPADRRRFADRAVYTNAGAVIAHALASLIGRLFRGAQARRASHSRPRGPR